ncbi:MAG TPA: flavin reductase family protein [Burkholderiaceae bacterium]|nr:flavin reductase family protein [Burkholderiaceae bacterium]
MNHSIAPFTERHFRDVVGRFPTGVTIITTETPAPETPIGLTISSFHSLSLQPPLILWTLTKKASSLPHFRQCDRYVIHVLSASQHALARQFSRGPQAERFQGASLTRSPDGTIMFDDPRCAAWLQCRNVACHDGGDHVIFVGQVEYCEHQDTPPLIYHGGDFSLTPAVDEAEMALRLPTRP